jgi:hypothetical protein
VPPTDPREFLSDGSETKPAEKGFGKDVHPKALASQRRPTSAGNPSVPCASSGKNNHPTALQKRVITCDDNASVCSDISEMTSNTNWTSVSSQQFSKQKRNLEPARFRSSLPNIFERSETPKPADQFNCRGFYAG